MATKPRDCLSGNQRSGLHMIERGFRPHLSTIRALMERGLVGGTFAEPVLNEAGEHYVTFGELPTVPI